MRKEYLHEETISVKGMHCKSCVQNIESNVRDLKGVDEIKVNLAENKATVRFDPRQMSLEKVKRYIESLGYSTSKGGQGMAGSADEKASRKKGFWQGVIFGLIPHIGCIAFIIASIFGVTVLMQFFKPLLMNRYFFYILILVSMVFATLSATMYLKSNGMLSGAGIRRKWKYLAAMYGTTLAINLLLFMVLFPLLANYSGVATSKSTGASANLASAPGDQHLVDQAVLQNSAQDGKLSALRLKVNIPCPGHAPLISNELKTIDGVTNIKFSFPNIFDVSYNSSKTNKEEIMSLAVFNEYKATAVSDVISGSAVASPTKNIATTASSQSSASPALTGSCGGGADGCGSAGGGCGCGGI